jgi:hypothetical protein
MGERALQRIAPDGAVRGVLDETRPDGERRLQMARGLLVDPRGDVYLAGLRSHNVLRIPSASAKAPSGAPALAAPEQGRALSAGDRAPPVPPGGSSRP